MLMCPNLSCLVFDAILTKIQGSRESHQMQVRKFTIQILLYLTVPSPIPSNVIFRNTSTVFFCVHGQIFLRVEPSGPAQI